MWRPDSSQVATSQANHPVKIMSDLTPSGLRAYLDEMQQVLEANGENLLTVDPETVDPELYELLVRWAEDISGTSSIASC